MYFLASHEFIGGQCVDVVPRSSAEVLTRERKRAVALLAFRTADANYTLSSLSFFRNEVLRHIAPK